MANVPFSTCDLISLAFDFLADSGAAASTADLAKAYRGLANPGAASGPATLLLDLHEHLFFTPTDSDRLEHLQVHAGPRVLDYGCGAGFYALHLARLGREVTCLELDASKLEFIRYAARRLGLSERLRFDLSPPYDSVLSVNVLDHVPDPGAMIDQIADVLSPGGRLFLAAHFEDDGQHTSDEAAIESAFRRLTRSFQREAEEVQLTPLLEAWRRRSTPAVDAFDRPDLRDALRPRRHPDLFKEVRADGSTRVSGEQFYLRPALLSPLALTILGLCDGRRTLAAISAEAGATARDSLDALRELIGRCFILFGD